MRQFLGAVLGLWLCSVTVLATAETVTDLYRQSEPVAGQGEEERLEALATALSTVLVRVSGQRQVLEQAAIRQALQQPEALLEAYRYESATAGREQAQLVVHFSRASIEALLRESGLPLWPANRPSVLVWLVQDDWREGRRLISLQGKEGLALTATEAARDRGLPLLRPLLDLQDQSSLQADQVWNQERERILEASERYRPDAVLIGRYSQTSNGRWLSAWTLLHKQHERVFDLEAEADSEMLTQALETSSDYLASLYAIVSSDRGVDAVAMQIEQVTSLADYVQVLAYLEELTLVRQLDLTVVDGERLDLSVRVDGDALLLEDALALDDDLQPVSVDDWQGVGLPEAAAPLGSVDNPLRYRWQRP